VRRLSVPIGAQGAIVSVEIGVSTPMHKALPRTGQSPLACAACDLWLALGSASALNLWRVDAIEVMGSEEPRSHGPRRERVLLYV
jgi:hypothetical protein